MDPSTAAIGAAVVSNFVKLLIDQMNAQKAPEWERPRLDSSVLNNLKQQLETMLSPAEIQQRVSGTRTMLGDINEKMIQAITAQPYGGAVRQKNLSSQISRGATQTEQTVNNIADELRAKNQNILQSVLGQQQNALKQTLGENVAARQADLQNLAFQRGQTGAGDVFAGLTQAVANAVAQYANVEQRKQQQDLLNSILQNAMQNMNNPLYTPKQSQNDQNLMQQLLAMLGQYTSQPSGQSPNTNSIQETPSMYTVGVDYY